MTLQPPAPVEEQRPFYLWAEVCVGALILMEVLWITIWYDALLKWRQTWQVSGGVLLGVFAGSYLLARAMNTLKWNNWLRLAAYLPWAALCLLGSVKLLVYPQEALGLVELIVRPIRSFLLEVDNSGAFYHLVIVSILMSRATSLARKPVDLWDAVRSFQIGLMLLLLFGAIFSATGRISSVWPVYGFIFFGLIAMTTARINTISVLRGGRLPILSRGWWFSLFAAALLVTGLGVLAGLIFSGGTREVAALLIRIFLAVVGLILFMIMSPLIPLIEALAHWLGSRNLQILPAQVVHILESILQEMQQTTNNSANKMLQWISAVSPYILGGALLLILLWAVTELGWLPWKRRLAGETETSSLTPRLGPRPAKAARPARLFDPLRLLAAARIRRVYVQLLRLSARLGAPRPSASTPLEHLPALTRLFPALPGELECITQAYNQIRYGMLPESEEEVQQVLAAWQAVRAEGRRLTARKPRSA